MKDAIKEFELLKKLIAVRFSSVIDHATLAVLLSAFDEYRIILTDVLSSRDKEKSELKEENNMLRSLAGADEAAVTATLLRQGEELRFVRGQLLSAGEELKASRSGADTLRLEMETAKDELKKLRQLRDEEQKQFQSDLGSLADKLKTFEQKIQEQQMLFEKEKEKILRERQDQGNAAENRSVK